MQLTWKKLYIPEWIRDQAVTWHNLPSEASSVSCQRRCRRCSCSLPAITGFGSSASGGRWTSEAWRLRHFHVPTLRDTKKKNNSIARWCAFLARDKALPRNANPISHRASPQLVPIRRDLHPPAAKGAESRLQNPLLGVKSSAPRWTPHVRIRFRLPPDAEHVSARMPHGAGLPLSEPRSRLRRSHTVEVHLAIFSLAHCPRSG